MTDQQIYGRLDLLSTVIKYARIKTAVFSTGELIYINQERASLFELLDHLAGLRSKEDCRCYEIEKALLEIKEMEHVEMCRKWRFAPKGSEIYFRSDLPTGTEFNKRLFIHFGGFTPQISKQLGH